MADFDMNPEGEMRDPKQMLHDMKTEARKTKNTLDQDFTPEEQAQMATYFGQGPIPTRGAEPGAPGSAESTGGRRIGSVTAGVYEGAGGYKYEVTDSGSVKILKAPKDRGLGVTLTRGMAYDAIMDELQTSIPEAPEAPEAPESDRRSRQMVGGVKPEDGTLAGAEMAKQKTKEAETAMAQNNTSSK